MSSQSGKKYKILQLQLKIQGTGTGYRKITIPDDYTFGDLQNLILLLHSWGNYHLHVFRVPVTQEKRTSQTPKIWVTDERTINSMNLCGDWEQEHKYEDETMLKWTFKNPKDRVYYEYDFGATIEMHINLQKVSFSDDANVKVIGGMKKDELREMNEEIQNMF
eukprot:425184_1